MATAFFSFWAALIKIYSYFRLYTFMSIYVKNSFLANYLRSSGNELAIVRISAICDAMLSNNSFGDKDIIIL